MGRVIEINGPLVTIELADVRTGEEERRRRPFACGRPKMAVLALAAQPQTAIRRRPEDDEKARAIPPPPETRRHTPPITP